MRIAVLLSFILASLYEVSAVENTSPFLAWSPRKFAVSQGLNKQLISVENLRQGVYNFVDCSHKAILVVDEPENQVQGAASSLQIPFVEGGVDLEKLAERLSQKCHTSFIDTSVVEVSSVHDPSVFYQSLTSDSKFENDNALERTIKEIRINFQDNFLVLYSSSHTKVFPSKRQLHARQLPGEPTPTKQAGIFHQYTFFSQGIFMGLLIMVIVIPIAIMGVFWNLSVQQPQRFEKKQN
ncbi:hypothetical protein BGZ54_003853 [Gamsiella multidivaricata]|nr:hypothetical protein BGZ54_003853 [Gamsiella multidivaricata]